METQTCCWCKSTAAYDILTDDSPFSGNSARGAVPPAESLGSLEAADRAADRWGGETGSFGKSLRAQTASQDHDAVEGQQHWDTRQVKQANVPLKGLSWVGNSLVCWLNTYFWTRLFACQERARAAGLSSRWPALHEMGCGKMEKGDCSICSVQFAQHVSR